jgi:hypothetical protein
LRLKPRGQIVAANIRFVRDIIHAIRVRFRSAIQRKQNQQQSG